MIKKAKKAKKILVIDDDPFVVKLLESRFVSRGYEVITACDGITGLEKAKSEKPDLITLDVMMPELNGYSVCGFLKADANYKNIPIIMLTVRSTRADKAFDDDIRPEVYMTKPFNTNELFARVENLIGA